MNRLAFSILFSFFVLIAGFPAAAAPLTAQYVPLDEGQVTGVMTRYGSVPGGVTLEGSGSGIPALHHVRYDPAANVFILNESLRYSSPVGHAELREIAQALEKDNSLGFSLGRHEKIFGALPSGGSVAEALKGLDILLGKAVFQNKPPQLYFDPFSSAARKGTAAYFRFGDYTFQRQENELQLLNARLNISLIPLIHHTDGTVLPDREALRTQNSEPLYESNIRYVLGRFEQFSQPVLQKTVRCGEAAAFLRTVKSSGQNLEVLLSLKNA